MSKNKKTLLILAIVLFIILAAVGGFAGYRYWYLNNHIFVEDAVYEKELTSLDLRGTGVSIEHYESVREQLPNCEIRWELPFQGGYLADDTTEIAITTLSDADVELLDYLTELTSVKAEGCTDYAQLLALQARRPEVAVTYTVDIGGVTCTESETELRYDGDEPETAELLEKLAYLPKMESIHYVQPQTAAADLVQLRETYPNIAITWEKDVMGTTYADDVAEFDFTDMKLETVDELEALMPYFPNLEKLIIAGCGLDNETLAAYRDRVREDYKVVWSVKIGVFNVRTDETYFMPSKYKQTVVDYNVRNLVYCEDMICVDLGHMKIYNVDWVKGMPNLKYLILADSPLMYIDALETCKNLVYLELFMTQVRDVTPLLGCTALEDLSLAVTPADPTPLAQMTWLKNLWFNMNGVSNANRKLLTESLPNTRIEFDHGWPTGGGWRELQNYYDMRDLLGMPRNTW